MDLSPADISGASFRTVRKGYDPEQVDALVSSAAASLEAARQHATAMEARARAAVARLQSAKTASVASATGDAGPTADAQTRDASTHSAGAEPIQIPAVEAATISRTLLLAQHTADTTIADAKVEAERIVLRAGDDAAAALDSAHETATTIVADARVEGRRASETERQAAENDVQALVARREFLVGDVDQLERFLIDQRDRLRDAARQIEALCERVPAGLGSTRPPALSASDDAEPGDPTQELTPPVPSTFAHDTDPDDASSDDESDSRSEPGDTPAAGGHGSALAAPGTN